VPPAQQDRRDPEEVCHSHESDRAARSQKPKKQQPVRRAAIIQHELDGHPTDGKAECDEQRLAPQEGAHLYKWRQEGEDPHRGNPEKGIEPQPGEDQVERGVESDDRDALRDQCSVDRLSNSGDERSQVEDEAGRLLGVRLDFRLHRPGCGVGEVKQAAGADQVAGRCDVCCRVRREVELTQPVTDREEADAGQNGQLGAASQAAGRIARPIDQDGALPPSVDPTGLGRGPVGDRQRLVEDPEALLELPFVDNERREEKNGVPVGVEIDPMFENKLAQGCRCMGLNMLKEESCNYPGLGLFANPAIDGPPPVLPLPPGDPPPEPVIPERPVEPADQSDNVAMADFFAALKAWETQATAIQEDYKRQIADYQTRTELYKSEAIAYQEAQIAQARAITPAEANVELFYSSFGWSWVDKEDSLAYWTKIIKTWLAQLVIILILFGTILYLQKRKDVT